MTEVADIVGINGPVARMFANFVRDPTVLEHYPPKLIDTAHHRVWTIDPLDRRPLCMWDALCDATERARVGEFAHALSRELIKRDRSPR